MRILRPVLTITFVVLVTFTRLGAQTTSTEVLGTVTDPTGGAVVGAKVTLLRAATGERREAATSSTGDYSFPLIEIGEYIVTVEASGFKRQERRGVMVQIQQKARVNLELSVGDMQETVQVTGEAPGLKTDDAAVGQVIDNKRVVELPLNGRNIATLALLTPGVYFGQRQGFDGNGGVPIAGRMVAIAANGKRENDQNVTLDGVVANEALQNTVFFTPSIDAIEEFKIQTSSYSSEYGQNSGALVQIAFKSGTNKFRGTLFEFLRHDKLAARDYFLNFQLPPGAKLQERPRLRRNQFGTFLSGPVVLPKLYNGKDRTFWSFNYEGLRETRESVQETFWFPEPFRRGDFSALLTPLIRDGRPIRSPIIIYDPVTGEPFRDASGRITNIIPASRINRRAQDFINKFQPLPQFQRDDILENNVQNLVPAITTSNQYIFRIDHHFRPEDKVFVRVALDRSGVNESNLNPNFPRFVRTAPNNIGAQHLHVFSPTIINEFRYGYNKADWNFVNPRTNTDFDLDSLGIGQFRVISDGNRKLTPRETGIPITIIGGDTDVGGLQFNLAIFHQVSDNLSINRANHGFKMGFEYRRAIVDHASSNDPRGFVSCCLGGNALAGWLLGYPTDAQSPQGLPFAAPRNNRWSAYFLDNWKLTRNLTANIGLRWDYFSVPFDANGGWRNLRLDVLSASSDGRQLPTLIPTPGTKGVQFHEPDNRYFMPRVGLAWRVTDKWVIRSGAGWFVNAQQLNNFQVMVRQPPRGASFTFNNVTDVAQVLPYSYAGQNYNIQTRRLRPGADVLTLDNPFPGAGTTPARTNLIALTPDNKYSNHWQWSLDLQRTLPWSTVLTVGYVGSKTSNLDNTINNFNNPDPSPNTDINGRRPLQAYVSEGEGNAARGIGNIRLLDSYANSNYQALQATLEKRSSHGLVMGLAYTYGKALGEGYERNNGVGAYQNPRDRRADRQRFPWDVTQTAVIHYVYEMPFLNRFKGVAGAFLAGWQTNGIISLRTGFPFSVGGGNLNTGGGTRPDRVADGRLGDAATREKWFDPTAFRRTECNIPNRADLCHYGNAGPGILTSPGQRTFDLSVYKNWRMAAISEVTRLQFRAEFFNAFNTPQFGQPNGIGWVTSDSIIPDAPRMGEIRGLRLPMRVIQFGLKLYF
ncbi:MAG: TonB-dependent receptor domain-containing protein [Blastocatellia bacterium]